MIDNEIFNNSDSESLADQELVQFTEHPALRELTNYFGFEATEDQDRLDQLQQFMTQNWEARNGTERQAVNWDDPDDPSAQEASRKVFELTAYLNMVESSHPKHDEYDYLVILGGANLAPFDRLRYGMEQGAKYKHIVLLGGGRKVGENEKPKTDTYAPGARTEFDLMNGAVETLLGDQIIRDETVDLREPAGRAEHDSKNWKVRMYELKDGTNILSLSSDFEPEKDQSKDARQHKNRSNSGDTYAFMREILGESMLNADAKALLVTNAFYTNAQHLDAVRELTLTTGAQVETIGYDAAYGGTVRTAKQLKQELKSGIDAAVRLQDAIKTQKESDNE